MTHPTYTQQALFHYTLPHLKRIAAKLGVTPIGDKRAAQTWVNAIIAHQSTQAQKVTDEQSTAQAELDHHIAGLAQAVAMEQLRIVEISFDHHEYYAGNQLIASISHDDNHLTQRWVVMVNEKEVFRANTVMRCHRFICTHYKDGSLPVQEQLATPCTTGNEIMAEISVECEKFGFDILNDGVYHNDIKLGEVGQTDAGWWFTHAADSIQQRIPCDSALDAVWWLSMVDNVPYAEAVDCEELLDRPFEMLTAQDLELLREYEPALELVAA